MKAIKILGLCALIPLLSAGSCNHGSSPSATRALIGGSDVKASAVLNALVVGKALDADVDAEDDAP